MRMEDKMNTVIAREKKIREQDGSTIVYVYIYIYTHTHIFLYGLLLVRIKRFNLFSISIVNIVTSRIIICVEDNKKKFDQPKTIINTIFYILYFMSLF